MEPKARSITVLKSSSWGIGPSAIAALRAAVGQFPAPSKTASTFQAVAGEWFEKNLAEGRAAITMSKIRWLLEITTQKVLLELRKVEAAGRCESARRMRSVFNRVFRYAIATARAKHDVAADLRGAIISPTVTHLAAIVTPDGAGQLLRSHDGFSGHEIAAYALTLAPHWFMRPGEFAHRGMGGVRRRRVGQGSAGYENEDAPATLGAVVEAGEGTALRPVRTDRPRAVSVPVLPHTRSPDVREYAERGAEPAGLQPNGDDLARLSRHGRHTPQRLARMASPT